MIGSDRRSGRTLMARAVGLLSRREHSRIELERKLRRHLSDDETEADLAVVLDRLQAQRLLSDARFAASLVRQRSPRYGDLRIARDLRERGVSGADADTALASLDGTEALRALAAWSRRFDTLPASANDRGRQGRYLQTRGFSMDAIRAVLDGKITSD